MPRDGSGTYSLPSGTAAVSGQTIESAKYNSAMDDLVDDANNARPVSAGGTGASSATGARTNLGLVIGTDVQAFNAYLADIAGLTLAEGDLLYFDGTDIVKLAKGTTDQYLRMNAAATAPEWATFNSSIQDIAGITFVAGDVMYYDGSDLVRLPIGTAGQVLAVNSGGTAPAWATSNIAPQAVIAEQRADGVHGTTLTSGTWTTLELNDTPRNVGSAVSLVSNQFTPASDGWVEWSAPGRDSFQTRLYNVTDSTVTAQGTSVLTAGGSVANSLGAAAVVSGKAYRLEQNSSNTISGRAAGRGGGEVYAQVKFWIT